MKIEKYLIFEKNKEKLFFSPEEFINQKLKIRKLSLLHFHFIENDYYLFFAKNGYKNEVNFLFQFNKGNEFADFLINNGATYHKYDVADIIDAGYSPKFKLKDGQLIQYDTYATGTISGIVIFDISDDSIGKTKALLNISTLPAPSLKLNKTGVTLNLKWSGATVNNEIPATFTRELNEDLAEQKKFDRKAFSYLLIIIALIALISWVVYSNSIDAKFKTTETTLDNIQYIVEYYPDGLLVSGKVFGNGEYVKRVRLESFAFSMSGKRDQERRDAIASYYKPYMNSVIDTLDEYNHDIQQVAIDQMQLKVPKDTIFSFFDYDSIKIEKEIIVFEKIVFSYNNNTKYVELSLGAFKDINKKYYRKGKPNEKFMEVSKRARKFIKQKLKAKILLADTLGSMPIIYELIDEKGNTVMKDEQRFDRL